MRPMTGVAILLACLAGLSCTGISPVLAQNAPPGRLRPVRPAAIPDANRPVNRPANNVLDLSPQAATAGTAVASSAASSAPAKLDCTPLNPCAFATPALDGLPPLPPAQAAPVRQPRAKEAAANGASTSAAAQQFPRSGRNGAARGAGEGGRRGGGRRGGGAPLGGNQEPGRGTQP